MAVAVLSSALSTLATIAQAQSISIPGLRAFPESLTSTIDGTLFIGRLGDGGIVRANSRTGEVSALVVPGASGSRSITGVFADEASNTLWACSNDLSALGGTSIGGDHGSALKGFDLRTGASKRSVPLPGPQAFCNDIAIDARGAVYVTDSAAPNVLRLPSDGTTFEVFASDPQFLPPKPGSAGLDGTLTREAFRTASTRSTGRRPLWLRAAPSWSSSSSDEGSTLGRPALDRGVRMRRRCTQ